MVPRRAVDVDWSGLEAPPGRRRVPRRPGGQGSSNPLRARGGRADGVRSVWIAHEQRRSPTPSKGVRARPRSRRGTRRTRTPSAPKPRGTNIEYTTRSGWYTWFTARVSTRRSSRRQRKGRLRLVLTRYARAGEQTFGTQADVVPRGRTPFEGVWESAAARARPKRSARRPIRTRCPRSSPTSSTFGSLCV